MGNTEKELKNEIDAVKKEIKATQKDMAELLKFRNKEEADFKQALKDDMDAADLLRKAIAALSSFYKRNKMDVPQLIQKAPEYAKDQDKAPDAGFADGNYGGRKSESGGILAILEMLVEDTEKEIADGRADDKAANEEYLEQNGALTKTLDAQKATKVGLEQELADCEAKIDTTDDYKKGLEADQQGNNGE